MKIVRSLLCSAFLAVAISAKTTPFSQINHEVVLQNRIQRSTQFTTFGSEGVTGYNDMVAERPIDPTAPVRSYSKPTNRISNVVTDKNNHAMAMSMNSKLGLASPWEKEDQRTPVRSGLTLDPCSSNSDCKGDRTCLDTDGACSGSDCYCIPQNPISCRNSAVCPAGEVCAKVGDAGTFCVSQEQTTPIPPPTDPPSTSGDEGGGLTLDPCSSNSDCKGDRTCLDTDGACSGSDCYCIPQNPISCTNSIVCPAGEVCAKVGDAGTFCVSQEQTTPVPPPTDPPSTNAPTTTVAGGKPEPRTSPKDSGKNDKDGVCIDARALGHMNKEELVFEEHSMAEVLCDSNESCATPGHIVHFNGKAMMMKTYCEIAGCERRSMLVNSPRYKKAIRVSSNTKGLEYTAFAARYSTQAEEMLLTSAVRLGL